MYECVACGVSQDEDQTVTLMLDPYGGSDAVEVPLCQTCLELGLDDVDLLD